MSKSFHVQTCAAFAMGSALPGSTRAHGPDEPPHQRFDMDDLKSESDEVIRDFSLSFVIHGTLNADKSNAIPMQALQHAVSYPDMTASIVPIIPLGRTPSWTTGVLEMIRQGIMFDPKRAGGNYAVDAPPEQGMRLWAGWLSGVITRTPVLQDSLDPRSQDAIGFIKGVEDAGCKRMDANDLIYQSWAYGAHDLGASPDFNGDYHRAPKSIKAGTLILAGTGDLLNPEYEAMEAGRYIGDVRYLSINATRPMGHGSGAGISAAEDEMQNREISSFLTPVAAQLQSGK